MNDHDPKPDGMRPARREFIKKSSVALAGGGLVSGGALLAVPGESLAQAPGALNADEVSTLLRMTRDVYPHDGLPDAIYMKVVEMLDGAAQKDPALAAMLSGGVQDLDAAARRAYQRDYAAVTPESARVELLRAMEATPFFQKIRGDMITGIYNNPEVWGRLGYEGASAQLGGYIKRGFDDIAWL